MFDQRGLYSFLYSCHLGYQMDLIWKDKNKILWQTLRENNSPYIQPKAHCLRIRR